MARPPKFRTKCPFRPGTRDPRPSRTNDHQFPLRSSFNHSMQLRVIDINGLLQHHFPMRTTLTLDDDVLGEAVKRAEALRISVGKAVSDLVRRGLTVAPPVREVDGLIVFDPPKGSPKISARKVKEALSDFP